MGVKTEMNAEDTARICSHFRRSIPSYEQSASVQKIVGQQLVEQLAGCSGLNLGKVLEVGCCTGSMTALLCAAGNVREIWVNDLVAECCALTAARVAGKAGRVHPVPGDIEKVELPANLDLIVSSSTYQWLKDLPTCFSRLAECVAGSGYFAFSMFGPGTMSQVQQLTGIGLDYPDEKELEGIVSRLFDIKLFTTKRYRIYFKTPRAVLRHIQRTGVGGVCGFRWTPSRLKAFEGDYYTRFGAAEGVPLDYVATTVIARNS